jgi:predicted nuclease of predicted toxin-antitoxin system
MIKFVIDEDMPRSTARALAERGFECLDIRDYGLRGKSDKEIFEFAQREKAILLTGDMGFGNILFFPLVVIMAFLLLTFLMRYLRKN